jgi:UDP-glucose 4-epimerase
MELEDMTALVTGGAGFVGSHLVEALLSEQCQRIIVIDNMIRGRPENLASAVASGRVRLIDGDIRDLPLMRQLVADSDVVFHQAALRITHCAGEPQLALDVMVDAAFQLFSMCAALGVRKVVAASSASVYGMADVFPTKETHHPYNDCTLYGAAKMFNEGLLRAFHDMYGIDYVALRYFNVYGPRMDIFGKYTEVLVRWMERADAGLPPLMFGDGLQTMDFIHVRDVARANILAARGATGAAVFNIGSGTETNLTGLARAVCEAMGRPDLQPEFLPERSISPVRRRLADVSAARDRLGFQAAIAFDEGIRDLVEWWRCERRRGAGASALAAHA